MYSKSIFYNHIKENRRPLCTCSGSDADLSQCRDLSASISIRHKQPPVRKILFYVVAELRCHCMNRHCLAVMTLSISGWNLIVNCHRFLCSQGRILVGFVRRQKFPINTSIKIRNVGSNLIGGIPPRIWGRRRSFQNFDIPIKEKKKLPAWFWLKIDLF